MATLELTAVGASTGLVIPTESLTHMRGQRGDSLHAVEPPEGCWLTPFDPAIESQLETGLRDEGLLDSALGRPIKKHTCEGCNDMAVLAR